MSQTGGSSQQAPPTPPPSSSLPGCACNASGTSCVDHLLMAASDSVSTSVVQVKFKVKNKPDFRTHVNSVKNNKPKALKEWWKKRMEEELKAQYEVTTGFVVQETASAMFILTCAHAMECCFDESQPLLVDVVKNLYTITVTCDHNELEHLNDKSKQRLEGMAEVVHVKSEKDLLLLSVNRNGYCKQDHPPVKLATVLPRVLGPVCLVSWPWDRHRTVVRGHFSHFKRVQTDITETNHHGYNFTALEVNITSESGSSGGPLIDLSADLVGLLHGGRTECVSYFVSLEEIQSELNNWGIKMSLSGSGLSAGTSGTKRKDLP